MEFVYYVVAQLLGSIFGCVLLGLIRRGKFKEMAGTTMGNYLLYTAGGTEKKQCAILVLYFLKLLELLF